MKKIIILLLLIGINIQMSLASVPEPKWENIAPEGYANAEYQENTTFDNKHPYLSTLTAMTIVGLPVAITSRNRSEKIDTSNYWFKRKNEFDEQKEFCKAIKNQDSKMNCFNSLIQSEHNKTAQREQILLQQQAIRQNAYNAMQTRNAINSMNNNLNRQNNYSRNINIYSYSY